jgi:hypothetical protein
MPRHKALAGLAIAAGSAAGAFLLRQRTAQRVEKADVHFADGTMVSLAAGNADGDALLDLARTALRSARA